MEFAIALEAIQKTDDWECILCGGPPVVIGCWVKNDDKRAMFYKLCEACADDPASIDAVEDEILAQARE